MDESRGMKKKKMRNANGPKGGRMHKENVRRLSLWLLGSDWVPGKAEQRDLPDWFATNLRAYLRSIGRPSVLLIPDIARPIAVLFLFASFSAFLLSLYTPYKRPPLIMDPAVSYSQGQVKDKDKTGTAQRRKSSIFDLQVYKCVLLSSVNSSRLRTGYSRQS